MGFHTTDRRRYALQSSGALGSFYVPPVTSGLIGLYDPNDNNSIILNGSDVAQLRDRSGSGPDLYQDTAQDQPGFQEDDMDFNGYNSITFNGTDHYIHLDYLPTKNPPYNIFLVINISSSSGNCILDGWGPARVGLNRIRYRMSAPNHVLNGVNSLTGSLAIDTINTDIHLLVANTTNSATYINGVQDISGDMGLSQMGGITLGAFSQGSFHSNFKTALILVYNNDLSIADKNLVGNDLATIFGRPWTTIV